MSRCEQEKPLFRWQSTFSSGFKGRWSTCSFLSEEQTAPSGLLFHVRFGIAHCCLVSFIKKRKRGDHFFFPNKTLVRRLPLVSQPGGHLPVLDVPPHPHVSKTAPEQHWSKEAPLGSLGCCKGQIYSGDPSWRGGYNAPSPFFWLLIIFEVRNLETRNSVKPHFKKHERRVNFLIFKISS